MDAIKIEKFIPKPLKIAVEISKSFFYSEIYEYLKKKDEGCPKRNDEKLKDNAKVCFNDSLNWIGSFDPVSLPYFLSFCY